MSRKTKPKSQSYGILPNGQIARLDTLLGWSSERRRQAREFKHAKVIYQEPEEPKA